VKFVVMKSAVEMLLRFLWDPFWTVANT